MNINRRHALIQAIEVMFASADECVGDDGLGFFITAPEFLEAQESFEELMENENGN